MKLTRWIPALLLAALLPGGAFAQGSGTVTGLVTSSDTQAPLSAVQVFVAGTTLGTLTNAQGRFIIVNVPAGPHDVRATRLGYGTATQSVTITGGGTATADFQLAPTAVALDEIVVTGTAGAVSRRSQPAVVATVNAADVVDRGVVSSVTDVLTARVPGVQVTSSSGSSGTSQQIRIRGASSISLSNEPLVFIDGVRANSSAQSLAGVGGQANSRLFDINPEDIESIEVVKGPAAATLYGADASSGVIQIITKKGRTGSGRFSQTVSLEYNNIDANFTPAPNAGTCTAAMVAAGSGRVLCEGQPVGTVVFDNPLVRTGAFREGRLRSLSYSARGGGDNYGYYISLNNDDEEGTLPNNTFERRSGRVNFNFTPTSKLSFDAGIGVYGTETVLPHNDNNIFGYLGGGYLGRPTNVRRNEDGNIIGGYYATGRELEAISSIENLYNTQRFTPTLQATYTPLDWLTNRLIIGADVTNGDITQFFPRNERNWYQGDTDTGDLEENRANTQIYTLDYLGTIRTNLSEAITGNFSFGTQVIREQYDRVTGTGVGFVTNANRVVGAATQISASQTFSEDRSIGVLAQADLGFNDRLFLQFGARVDQNSSFGENADPFFLPKLGVSYVISEEGFWTPVAGVLPTMRLRAAYGSTGRQPTPGASLETYEARPFAIIGGAGSGAGVIPDNPGNLNLKPERGQEFEAGFDAGFLNDRFGVELTYFNKKTTDLLLERPIPPSSGFTDEPFVNIGEVLNEGLEYALRGALITTPNFRWEARVAGSTLNNELVDLGDVEPFGSFNRFTAGRPLGSFVSRVIRGPSADGTRLVVSDTLEYLGNVLPTNEGNVGSTITLFDHLQVFGQVDWKGGFKVYNNTAQFRDRQFRNSEVGVQCEVVFDPDACMRRFGPFISESGATVSSNIVNEAYIEDGDFFRLREVAATLSLPAGIARRLRATSASLTVGGRNLALWTDYTGSDPEVLSNANAGFSRSDFLTVPPSRRWVIKANLSF